MLNGNLRKGDQQRDQRAHKKKKRQQLTSTGMIFLCIELDGERQYIIQIEPRRFSLLHGGKM